MESAQDLATLFRRLLLLMAARSGDHEKLVGELEDAAAEEAMAGWPSDVVIDLAAASEGDTELHQTAAGGDGECYLECARVACGKDKGLLLARNKEGDTALHCTARAGHPGMVKRLIDLAQGDGQDHGETAREMVSARNKRRETALHDAIRSSDKDDMVSLLMAVDHHLARVYAYDGTSPLFLAISVGHRALARSLYDKYDKELSYSGPEGQGRSQAPGCPGHGLGRGSKTLRIL